MASKGKGREVNISLAIQRSAMTGKNKEIANFYNLDVVPDDIWLFLFEYLTTPDLNSMSKVSKKFYALTQRPLLRELTWAKATGASRNVQDWADGGPLEPFRGVVRKVNIKLSYKKVNQNSALLLPVDWELYDSIHHRLLSFTNLRTLEFQNTIITPALYQVLEGIPSLRELSIVRCVFMWTYIYFPLLTNLGRQAPSPGLFVYNPNSRTYAHQHGLSRAPTDPAQRAVQQQWLVDNASFDFVTRLSHITNLTLQFNRFHHSQADTDDAPYGPSEINRPCILHPLYLLSLPSLTHLDLTWTPTLAQIYETLRQPLIQQPNGGANGAMAALQQQQQIASLLFAANSLNVNLFTPLVTGLHHLVHAAITIDDLGRDIIDSITSVFQQRVQNSPPGMAPLRIHLRVKKHTLTEQNMNNSQFRLPGVYRYEGPLPITALLVQDSATDMEEVFMNEPMEMNLILIVLEKLPRTLRKLHLRMHVWDREILYAAHSLFKHMTEFVVRFGKGALEENTFVVLGSDILPDLKELNTIKLIYSPDCVKREQQFRSYHTPSAHPHHHYLQGPANWWNGGPPPGGPGGGGHGGHGGAHGGGGFGGHGGAHGGGGLGGHGNYVPHIPPADQLPPPVPPPPPPSSDAVDSDTSSPTPPPPQNLPAEMMDMMQDEFYDMDDEEGQEMLAEMVLDSYRRQAMEDDAGIPPAPNAGPSNTGSSSGSSSSMASSSTSGSSSGPSSSATVAAPSTSGAASSGASSDPDDRPLVHRRGPHHLHHPQDSSNSLRSLFTSGQLARPPSSPTGPSTSTTRPPPPPPPHHHHHHHHHHQHRRFRLSEEWNPGLGGTAPFSFDDAFDSSDPPPVDYPVLSAQQRMRRERERERPLTINEPPRREPPPGPTMEDRARIAQSLEEDLGDYLVGWNRHCRSLRVVQMEPGVMWVRRYEGDGWQKKKP